MVLLSGCETSAGTRTRAEGAAAGGLAGAVIGGLVGLAVGGQGSNFATSGAITGAKIGVGSFPKISATDHVARKKHAYARTEDYLNACIQNAQQVNASATGYGNDLRNNMAILEGRIDDAVASSDSQEKRNCRRELRSYITEAQQQIGELEKEMIIQMEVIRDHQAYSQSSILNTEVSNIGKTHGNLSASLKHLDTFNTRLDR
ncbi:MAG: hypothetical protein ACFCU3_08870 [Verrucomicrobiales bacterium]